MKKQIYKVRCKYCFGTLRTGICFNCGSKTTKKEVKERLKWMKEHNTFQIKAT